MTPGTRPDTDDRQAGQHPERDQSDQLSPNRALRDSLGSSGSQRVGDNGPVANPIVSFPDEPGDDMGGDGETTSTGTARGRPTEYDQLTWGPRHGPQTPQRSGRPGGAVAPLDNPTDSSTRRERARGHRTTVEPPAPPCARRT